MDEAKTYTHLTVEERAVAMIEKQNGASLRSIGRRLGRSVSTISRELKRSGSPWAYHAPSASEAYRQRRRRSR